MPNEYNFDGENKLSVRRVFESRKKYRDEALFDAEEDTFVSGVQDFFLGEKLSFYGRLDDDKKFVALYPARAHYFDSSSQASPGTGTTPRAADFVVDAYKNFKKEFEKLLAESRCGIGPDDVKVKVVSAWQPVADVQRGIHSAVKTNLSLDLFSRPSKTSRRVKQELLTVEQFLEQSVPFFEKATKVSPITGASILCSSYCSVATSGLSITLDKLDFSKDGDKATFMNSNIFDFYRQAALAHGFMINRNAPWQLVANIDSDAMATYMAARATSREELWNTHYYRAQYNDIEQLQVLFLTMWNAFVSRNPYSTRREPTCDGKSTRPMTTRRRSYRALEFSEKFDNAFWINLYCKVKSYECQLQSPIPSSTLSIIAKNAIRLEKSLDIVAAIDYINDQFVDKILSERLSPEKFFPRAKPTEKGQASQYQSNVIIETSDY